MPENTGSLEAPQVLSESCLHSKQIVTNVIYIFHPWNKPNSPSFSVDGDWRRCCRWVELIEVQDLRVQINNVRNPISSLKKVTVLVI